MPNTAWNITAHRVRSRILQPCALQLARVAAGGILLLTLARKDVIIRHQQQEQTMENEIVDMYIDGRGVKSIARIMEMTVAAVIDILVAAELVA
jgi:hypothetical protein